jgi:hypothetical protein
VTDLVLEVEGGKLLYSLDIKVPGKAGITEVHVDAGRAVAYGSSRRVTRSTPRSARRGCFVPFASWMHESRTVP